MKKGLYLFLILALIGCSSTPYEKVAVKGYRVSKSDDRFVSKEGEMFSHYKYNEEDAAVYMIIEKNEVTEEVKPFLNIEYTGKDWIYMEKVKFSTDKSNDPKEVEIDFLKAKFSGALGEEKPGITGNVVERILVPISDEKIEELEEVLGGTATTMEYSSRYRDRKHTISLTLKEREGLITMIKLYNKVKGENDNGN